MKKLVLIAVMALGTTVLMSFTKTKSEIIKSEIIKSEITLESEFNKGFADGYCEGWKDVKGKYVYCPYAPYAPYPTLEQSADSYRDGYNTGFKAGRRKAQND